MSYNLFLDDVRMPQDVKWVNLPSVEWTIVRNYEAFCNIIIQRGLPRFIAFDHDLADEHYGNAPVDKYGENDYTKYKEMTGYDCAKWLCDYCIDSTLYIPDYIIHSLNPIGAANINSIIQSAKKSQL